MKSQRLNKIVLNGLQKNRFSEQTINQAAAVFGWGDEDTNTLKKTYPNYSSKIHITGSPRADMWSPVFSDYWGIPKDTA